MLKELKRAKNIWISKNIKNGFEMASTFEEGQFLPYEWWELFGSCAPTLKPIAVRVLSQICRASSYERNWSNHGFVHSKSQNHLGTKRAKDLVYLFSTLKLQRKRCGNKLVAQTRVEEVGDSKDYVSEAGTSDEGVDDPARTTHDSIYGTYVGDASDRELETIQCGSTHLRLM